MGLGQNYLNTVGLKPLVTELKIGELVPNMADNTLWTKDPAGIVKKIGGTGGGGSETFLGLTDTPVDYTGQGSYTVKVKVDETGLEFVTDPAGTHEWAEANPTGLINGGELNIIGADIEVIEGSAVIIDSYTNPDEAPVITLLSWPTLQSTITGPATPGNRVRFTIAKGSGAGPIAGTTLGYLVEYDSTVSPTTIRNEVTLGYTIFDGTVWGEVSSPAVINNTASNFFEYLKTLTPITTTISGGKTTESNVFSLSRDSGMVWELNRNWHTDKTDPNRETFPVATNFEFKYMNQNQDVSAATTLIDPTQYDDSGVLTPVSGNDATIQRLYKDQRDNYWMLYGQVSHNNWNTALARFNSDTSVTEVPDILQDAELLGYVIAQGNVTQWSTGSAEFFEATKLTSTNSSGSNIDTLIGLLDTPLSYTGETGKMLIVNALEDGMEFVTPTGGTPIDSFKALVDTPNDYTGQATKKVVVALDELGLEFVDDTSSGGQVDSIVAGTNVTVDATDPINPTVNVPTIGVIQVGAGTGCTVDATDPASPIVNVTPVVSGQVNSVVAGTNCTVDVTDPINPIVNVADMSYDPTTIQAEVDLNTAKVGITPTQASDITTNNAKVGVTSEIKSVQEEGVGIPLGNIIQMTAAEHGALTATVPTTMYVIVG